jgi:hypothetical protein
MERKVKIADYEEKQHLILAALNLVGIPVDYITVDLIDKVLVKFAEKGGQLNIMDAVEIKEEHAVKWDTYFRKQEQ